MLPDLNENGDLPEGIHRGTVEDVLYRFGSATLRRAWLSERFRELLEMARNTNKLRQIFLWGSFVTSKPFPRDIDVFLVMAEDFTVEIVAEDQKMLFNHSQANLRFASDVFWMNAASQEAIELSLDTFQTRRDGQRRGIVEVVIT
ncbi:MAG TPA: hypothetical protein VNA19_04690 [Pyrinomonadaceae bacterium]|jgi:hypothetical protein|nr:hypothetical protein [Pyrinomonadaceae bacterium]